jgi:DNA-binding PadR family transcriptional regulator
VRQDRPLPTTSYALLGLLSFGQELSGYELKQWADSTLRFYWVAPAMSQIYSEMNRLTQRGLVDVRIDDEAGTRVVRRYLINDAGLSELREWLATSRPEFPILKHPVALRLLLGHLVDPATVREMLQGYVDSLDKQRADLQAVLDGIDGAPGFRYPAFVARWGLAYYDDERRTVEHIRDELSTE